MLAKFLSTNWLGLLVGAILSASVAFIPLMITTARLDTRTAELGEARTRVASLSASIERQNDAVLALEAAAAANREVYLAGLAAANRRAIRLEIDAERILALPSPTDPTEQCEAAHALLLAD